MNKKQSFDTGKTNFVFYIDQSALENPNLNPQIKKINQIKHTFEKTNNRSSLWAAVHCSNLYS